MKSTGVAISVRQRLLTLAQSRNWEFNRVLTRYGVERVLCRLAVSSHGERFLLKGATLFTVWEGSPHRATRDLDLLGLRRRSLEELVALFREIMAAPVEPDGLEFGEVTAEPIRSAMEVGGIRILLRAVLAKARIQVQVDVGFGDATVPPPIRVEFPTLLNTPRPKLWAYAPETVIAEKLEAMVRLGPANTRMKDFFDVWYLAQCSTFQGDILESAIHATFAARKTPASDGLCDSTDSRIWQRSHQEDPVDGIRSAGWRVRDGPIPARGGHGPGRIPRAHSVRIAGFEGSPTATVGPEVGLALNPDWIPRWIRVHQERTCRGMPTPRGAGNWASTPAGASRV